LWLLLLLLLLLLLRLLHLLHIDGDLLLLALLLQLRLGLPPWLALLLLCWLQLLLWPKHLFCERCTECILCK
jgi:hypothetical protein